MSMNKTPEQVWGDFLQRWPQQALPGLTLAQYAQGADEDCFSGWLRYLTNELGWRPGGGTYYSQIGISSLPARSLDTYRTKPKYGVDQQRLLVWLRKLGTTAEEAFEKTRERLCQIAEAAARGDVSVLSQPVLYVIYEWKLFFIYQNRQQPVLLPLHRLDDISQWYHGKFGSPLKRVKETDLAFALRCNQQLMAVRDGLPVFDYVTHLKQMIEDRYLALENQQTGSGWTMPSFTPERKHKMPALNQILYGPPGTGKTYETIHAALQILDPAAAEAYKRVDRDDESRPDERLAARKILKTRFDELRAEQRVHFVTFHQSFSYEDFVEGLRAETVNGQLQYRIEAGIFKKICKQARPVPFEKILAKPVVEKINSSNEDFELFSDKYELVTQAISNYARYISKETRSRLLNTFLKWFSSGAKPKRFYSQESGSGHINVYVIGDNLAHASVPDVYYDEVHPLESFNNKEQRKVQEVMGILHAIYETSPSSSTLPYPDLQSEVSSKSNDNNLADGNHIASSPCVSDVKICKDGDIQPHVLIIDEINRGNISRIFGELITLIEPSKRAGADEALSVTLPYSKDSFSVPDNVYLIGTMNTADRSLAGLDLALRRRFSFTEMPPRPALLKDINIEGAEDLDLAEMLTKMNQRITVLLDRDHTIGHAYFMPLQKMNSTPAKLTELADIFRQKILPLLQEYFFEDWERIRWVLNDQNKPDSAAFIIEDAELNLSALFGDVHNKLRQTKKWMLNPKAFAKADTYRGIAANLGQLAQDGADA